MKAVLFLTLLSTQLWSQTPGDVQTIRQRLNSAPSNCSSLLAPVSNNLSLNNSTALRDQVMSELITKASNSCLRTLAQNLSFANNPADQAHLRRILERLALDSDVRYNPLEYTCVQATSGIEEIITLSQSAKRVTTCSPVNANEWRVINTNNAPTGLSADYALHNAGNNQWNVAVAIDVKSGEGIKAEDMHRRISQCMEAINPFMTGGNGEKLNIQILTKQEAQRIPSNKRPPINPVSIQPSGARSNSRAYAADASCSTIVHEVLHLLGLCDEYDGKGDGYGCRSVPDTNSIMKDHWAVFDQAVTRQLTCECVSADCANLVASKNQAAINISLRSWAIDPLDYDFRNDYCQTPAGSYVIPLDDTKQNSVALEAGNKFKVTTYHLANATPGAAQQMFPVTISCECPAGDTKCLQKRDEAVTRIPNNTPRECPQGTNERMIHYGTAGEFRLTEKGYTLPVRALPNTSVLLPVHFKRIVGGTCPDVTPEFNECSRWAYSGTYNNNDCSQKPAHCQGDNWWK